MIKLTPQARGRFVFTGQTMLRFHSDRPLVDMRGLTPFIAGTELNMASAAASVFGLRTELVTSLPGHAIGRCALNEIRRYGVGVTDVVLLPFSGVGEQDRMPIFFTATGESVVDRYGGTGPFYEGQREWGAILAGAELLVSTGITIGLDPVRNADRLIEAAQCGRRLDCGFLFDLGYRPTQWQRHGGVDAFIQQCRRVVPEATILTGNEGFFQQYFGGPAALLAEHEHLQAVVVTRRTEHTRLNHDVGVSAYLKDGTKADSPMFPLAMIDRIGGGDAAIGIWLGAYVTGRPLETAVNLAAAALAHVSGTLGDQLLATLAELEALVAGEVKTLR